VAEVEHPEGLERGRGVFHHEGPQARAKVSRPAREQAARLFAVLAVGMAKPSDERCVLEAG